MLRHWCIITSYKMVNKLVIFISTNDNIWGCYHGCSVSNSRSDRLELSEKSKLFLAWHFSVCGLEQGWELLNQCLPSFMGMLTYWVPSQYIYIYILFCYGDFYYKDKTVLRPYFYNGNAYADKTASLYWDGPWTLYVPTRCMRLLSVYIIK